jgi:hypothetical protein
MTTNKKIYIYVYFVKNIKKYKNYYTLLYIFFIKKYNKMKKNKIDLKEIEIYKI